MIIIANWYFALDYILSLIASFKVTPIVCHDYMKQLGWVGLTLTVPLITNPDSQRLLFWLYTWWLYVQFSPKKWRCYVFNEALKWLILFLKMVRFSNIKHFCLVTFFLQVFVFYKLWLYMQFSPKKRRCYLFKEALKWLVLFLEVARFYNVNDFLFIRNFLEAFVLALHMVTLGPIFN